MKINNVAVVGSREVKDRALVFYWLDMIDDYYNIRKIISGGARGVDKIAEEWADQLPKITKVIYPAKWIVDGQLDKSAGFKRNHDIVRESDMVIAFWDGISRGTKHAIDLARKYNKHHLVIYVKKRGT